MSNYPTDYPPFAPEHDFVFNLEIELRKQRLNRTQLADRMGISRSAVSRLLDPDKHVCLTLL